MTKPRHFKKAAQEHAPTKAVGGKLGILIDLLSREAGVSVNEMSSVTGWQAHSVRGAMSGALKKKRGLTIVSEVAEGGRIYRIAQAAS